MIRSLVANSIYGFIAWQQADLVAQSARHGFATGALTLFACLLANTLFGAWWRGHP